ncbi:MAG: hypothetical protein JSR80_00295 [Verrucomicrobia bacterium]|nr:hypothetical protein [Verrucomicrobiota bacterium]
MNKLVTFFLFFIFGIAALNAQGPTTIGGGEKGAERIPPRTRARDYCWSGIPEDWLSFDCEDHSTKEGATYTYWMDSDSICWECFLEDCKSLSTQQREQLSQLGLRDLPSISGHGKDPDFDCPVCSNKAWHHITKYECIRNRVYSGYLHWTYRGGYPFLEKQLNYTRKYPNIQAYWVETSVKAAAINEMACKFFRGLVESTALRYVDGNPSLKKNFPIGSWHFETLGYAFPIALASQCFRFSDYYRVVKDLMLYSETHFPIEEADLIIDKLEDLLEELVPRFMDMYRESMANHPTPEIAQEVELIHCLLGGVYGEAFAFHASPLSDDGEFDGVMGGGIDLLQDSFSCARKKKKGKSPAPPPSGSPAPQPRLHPVDWTLSLVYLAKGQACNEFLLYNAALESLTEAIRLNPRSEEAYIERAYAYFELGEIALALADHQKYKALKTVSLFNVPKKPTSIQRPIYDPMHFAAFAQGLCIGTLEGAAYGVVDFVPSVLSCFRGILKGLWAHVCSPAEVKQEFAFAVFDLIEYIRSHSTHENLGLLIPELRELCEQWDLLSHRARGHQIGYMIGKYGIEVFAPGAALKGASKYRRLKQANTVLTLERCGVTEIKRSAILSESAKHFSKRQTLVAEITTKGKIFPKNANDISHLLQEKHAWEQVVPTIKHPIKGKAHIEENFKAVVALLEEEGMMSEQYFKEFMPCEEGVTAVKHHKVINGRTVEVIFETNLETKEMTIKNGWVVTKK